MIVHRLLRGRPHDANVLNGEDETQGDPPTAAQQLGNTHHRQACTGKKPSFPGLHRRQALELCSTYAVPRPIYAPGEIKHMHILHSSQMNERIRNLLFRYLVRRSLPHRLACRKMAIPLVCTCAPTYPFTHPLVFTFCR